MSRGYTQTVDPAVFPIGQPERMGVRHAGDVAKAAKCIDYSHFFVDYKAPVNNVENAGGDADMAVSLRIIFWVGICAALQPGAWSAAVARSSLI